MLGIVDRLRGVMRETMAEAKRGTLDCILFVGADVDASKQHLAASCLGELTLIFGKKVAQKIIFTIEDFYIERSGGNQNH